MAHLLAVVLTTTEFQDLNLVASAVLYNLGMLERACEALRPGGRFLLDTMNAPGVREAFLPVVETERDAIDASKISGWSVLRRVRSRPPRM